MNVCVILFISEILNIYLKVNKIISTNNNGSFFLLIKLIKYIGQERIVFVSMKMFLISLLIGKKEKKTRKLKIKIKIKFNDTD